MINGFSIKAIILINFLISFILTFFAKKIAFHVSAIDIPNQRKVHKEPIPRLGGIAIFLSFLLGYMIYGTVTTLMLSVLIGGIIVVLTGIIDDINPIPARWKFLSQLFAASIVVFYGKLFFTDISFLGHTIVFSKWLNMLISVFFIISTVNIINLIDGLDGLASGISSIYFITIAVIGFILNRFGGLDVILSLIMLGATLGFLAHNFPPAKIFMGDTGSLFLGFMIAIIALIGYKMTTIISIIIPIIILFIPILDTFLAIVRRLLKGESIGTPDKEHLHHQLLKLTSSPTKTILIIYFINILFSSIAIFYIIGDTKMAIILYVSLIIFFIYIVLKTDILFKHNKKQ